MGFPVDDLDLNRFTYKIYNTFQKPLLTCQLGLSVTLIFNSVE